jgi:hypothetical protein
VGGSSLDLYVAAGERTSLSYHTHEHAHPPGEIATAWRAHPVKRRSRTLQRLEMPRMLRACCREAFNPATVSAFFCISPAVLRLIPAP